MSFIKVAGNIATSALGGVVQRSVSNSPTVTKTSPNAALFDGLVGGINSVTNLAYPENVVEDPQQGHYISFYIRVIDQAKLEAFKKAKSLVADSNIEFGGDIGAAHRGPTASAVAKAKKTLGESGKSSNAIILKSRPTKRLDTAISLYMPPSVLVSYESKYGEQEIGFLAEGGYEAIKAFQKGDTKKAAMSAIEGLEMGAKLAILKTLDVAAPGASALFAIDRGKIITPKMELMFEGIGRRNFSFTFMFMPKSQSEAHGIEQIVFMFKKHMAANYAGGGANGLREMTFPDQFDIEYMHMGKRNPYLNKIATCALTKMDVEYGGDRYVAYDGGIPQTTKLTLNFAEFEIITRDHIKQGF